MNKKIIAVISIIVILLVVVIGFSLGRHRSASALPLSASGLFNQARGLEAKNELLSAKTIYQKLINDYSNANDVMNWQKKLEDINIRLLFSSAMTPKSTIYEIKPGDTLVAIARQFNTTPELIMKSNNLTLSKILPGRKIKVWTAPFSILVDKSQNTLILKTDEEVIKTYIVATGKDNSTPVGTFKIVNKLPNPTWFKSGAVILAGSPENILGTRWMGFDLAGYGIHGTTDPKNLGKQVTDGCVRMSNQEVEELYTIVPQGTEVTIVD